MSRVFEKDAVYLMVIISVWKKRFIIKMGLKAKTFFPKTSLENNHKKVVQFQPNDVKHFNVFSWNVTFHFLFTVPSPKTRHFPPEYT